MAQLLNLVRVVSATTGTGAIVLGAAVQGFLTADLAGAVEGQPYAYGIEGSYVTVGDDQIATAREQGIAVYGTVGGGTLTGRTPINSTNGNAALNLTGDQQVIVTTAASMIREKLTENRTYYVRPDGSDLNSGLVNTAAGAFLTRQKAANVVQQTLDFAGKDIVIQCAAGTYTTPCSIGQTVGQGGAGGYKFVGDEATPSNVLISITDEHGFEVGELAKCDIRGFKIVASGAVSGIQVSGQLSVRAMDFGACGFAHIDIRGQGAVEANDYEITAGAEQHVNMQFGIGMKYSSSDSEFTVTGTPAFSDAFVAIANQSTFSLDESGFTGSATGARYDASQNSILSIGSDPTAIPGSTAGSCNSGSRLA